MTSALQAPERGLLFWMKQVVAEAEKASQGLDADPVHDLRVAIRRCRAIGEGFVALDPYAAWKKMRKGAKPLFSVLGELRDVQVLMEWVQKLAEPDDDDVAGARLMSYCQQSEQELKSAAANELAKFDRDEWMQWADALEQRTGKIPVGGEVFQLMALERWEDARRLHAAALRNRSKLAMHALRIGIKKFRYIVENFLPEHHERWKKDLKRLQDLLGEVHDLDVLWDTAKANRVFQSAEERVRWLESVKRERGKRVDEYRKKMVGRDSLWHTWRAELPQGEVLSEATRRFFETWAFYRDTDLSHTYRVLEMSFAIYDAVQNALRVRELESVGVGELLRTAVVVHNVAADKAKPHKRVQKMVERMRPPPGWTSEHMKVVGLGARYQSGKLPGEDNAAYRMLKRTSRRVVDAIAAVLRLAEAFDADGKGSIPRIEVRVSGGNLVIDAAGYKARSKAAERIAAARHLLESITKMPVVVREMSVPTEG